VGEALKENHIGELRDFESIYSEVTWKPGCRFDFMLQSQEKGTCYVEVKNVTLYDSGKALFPDARTERGLKHLHELIQVREAGFRAVIFFLVHRDDCNGFRPAEEIDPDYALALKAARQAGVEVLAYRTAIAPPVVQLSRAVKLEF
jgi:sugar fermentation stimulation protein A